VLYTVVLQNRTGTGTGLVDDYGINYISSVYFLMLFNPGTFVVFNPFQINGLKCDRAEVWGEVATQVLILTASVPSYSQAGKLGQ
jgi:hypothetical protein